MVNDPIGDLLARIRNAQLAGREHLDVPHSKLKENIAKLLVKEGYLAEVRRFKQSGMPGKTLSIDLKSGLPSRPVIRSIERFSRPGRRSYKTSPQLKPFLREGTVIVSTSKGLMTGKQAVKRKLGGEMICWVK